MLRSLPLAATLLLACASASPRPTVKVPRLAGKPLDAVVQDLEGREVRIEPAGKVVVIDFFASWCLPCRVQLPHLDQLARDLGGQGLSVYAVSFDEDLAALQDFGHQVPVGFPVLWDRGGERLARQLGIERLPTTLLVDRAGIIREVHVGYDSREAEELDAQIRALLSASAPP